MPGGSATESEAPATLPETAATTDSRPAGDADSGESPNADTDPRRQRGRFRATETYTPGLRSLPEVEGPSPVRQASQRAGLWVIGLLGQVIAALRASVPIVRARAIEVWSRRPRSRAEAV
ncbi:hypothetical protein ACWELJ_14350, partial [Nocardia sp. NPDC004582]